jgi:pimeloyl-ACP methyl ester carboxylesterase
MTTIAPRPEPALEQFDHAGAQIALRRRRPTGDRPTILFLPGYGSDMAGIKARAIDDHCATHGLGCLRLDYSGTGLSSGEFADGTLDRWLDEVLAAIDRIAVGRVLIVGSSMGGWIALHAALRRPDRVAALLGIAAAPDFTDWGFASDEEKVELLRDGRLERLRPDGSVWLRTRAFWQSGQAMLLLDAPIALDIPVGLVHGAQDNAVPAAIALRLFERLESTDVQLRLIKDAGHNLSDPDQLRALLAELDRLVDRIDPPLSPVPAPPHVQPGKAKDHQ